MSALYKHFLYFIIMIKFMNYNESCIYRWVYIGSWYLIIQRFVETFINNLYCTFNFFLWLKMLQVIIILGTFLQLYVFITILITFLSSCQKSFYFNINITLYNQYTLYVHRTDCNSNLIYYYVHISIARPYV